MIDTFFQDFILTESDCRMFMRQITLGMEYLHDNHVVHLDMKVLVVK